MGFFLFVLSLFIAALCSFGYLVQRFEKKKHSQNKVIISINLDTNAPNDTTTIYQDDNIHITITKESH